ncbi:ankyrin repeat-containing domain protein [Aspergillus venezuelensis]
MKKPLRDIGTPLKAAVLANHKSVVDLLLSAGANLHQYTVTEISYLLGGGKVVDCAICETLVTHGLDINVIDPFINMNLLQLACLRGAPGAHVQFLLDNGLQNVIGWQDSNGKPPLCLAVESIRHKNSSDCDVLQVLSQHGAQVNPMGVDPSPLRLAVQWSSAQAVRLLLQFGANANEVTSDWSNGLDGFAWHTSGTDEIDLECDIFEALVHAGASFGPGFAPNNLLERVSLVNHGRYARLIHSCIRDYDVVLKGLKRGITLLTSLPSPS